MSCLFQIACLRSQHTHNVLEIINSSLVDYLWESHQGQLIISLNGLDQTGS